MGNHTCPKPELKLTNKPQKARLSHAKWKSKQKYSEIVNGKAISTVENYNDNKEANKINHTVQ